MRRTLVFGPAYLDRVLHVDRPLLEPNQGAPLDGSVEGTWTDGPGLRLVDPNGGVITIDLTDDWPGPTGSIQLSRPLLDQPGGWSRTVQAVNWHDDLGGMGAGFAASLGGTLVNPLGHDADPASRFIRAKLTETGIVHRPIPIQDRPTDWTLLVTSGAFGDKLPVGFRACLDGLDTLGPIAAEPCDLRVVASLPNRLASEILRASGAKVRAFAPTMRNAIDTFVKIGEFSNCIDIMFLNRKEWNALADPGPVLSSVPILAITDGPRGSLVRARSPDGGWNEVQVNAFPRSRPPRDTNRAGEAYAATLLTTLLDHGWTPGPVAAPLIRLAAERASAAAALVLDRLDFGFPSPSEIDRALRLGRID